MTQCQDGKMRGRIGMLLKNKREAKGLSLRGLCRNISSRLQIELAPSTLTYWENNGPSSEASRFLALFKYYGIKLDSLFNDQKPNQKSVEFELPELFKDKDFLRFYGQLNKLKPKFRKGMIRALSIFVQSFRTINEERKEKSK